MLLCWKGGGEKGDERSDVGVLMVGPYGDWLRFPYHMDEEDEEEERELNRGDGSGSIIWLGNDNAHICPETNPCHH